jgi:hypothetical protein
LTYIYGSDTPLMDGFPSDIHTIFFRNENWKYGPIELPHYSKEQIDRVLMGPLDLPDPLEREPPIANNYVAGTEFQRTGFTHMILSQSPGYTPASADSLIPVIQQYFYSV